EPGSPFYHLALTDRQVTDNSIRSHPVDRKNFIEFAANEFAGTAAPAPSRDARVEDASILRHGEIRAERQFLENTADPKPLSEDHSIVLPRFAADDDCS